MPILKYRPEESASWQVVGITADGYSKEEADALLANKAPAGFGLGETAGKLLTASDNLNTVNIGGWYKWTSLSVPANTPETAYGAIEVIPFNRTVTIQKYYRFGDSSLNNYCAIRQIWDNDTGEWEWKNPPFNVDVVYRTVERHLGNPVYKKMDSSGVIWWSTDQTNWKAEAERVGAASKETETRVMTTSLQSNVSVSIQASELQSYINSLPKMITRNYYITVSGNCSDRIVIQDFYGSGMMKILATDPTTCSFSACIDIYNCNIQITLEKLSFNPPEDYARSMVSSAGGSCVTLSYCEFIGTNKTTASGTSVQGFGSYITVEYCKFQNLYIALHCFTGGILRAICNAEDVSNNEIGMYCYYGGIIQLVGSTPTDMGGSYNTKNGGGAFINASGQLF